MKKLTILTPESNFLLFLGAVGILYGIPLGISASENKSGESDIPLAVVLKLQPRLESYLKARTGQISELTSKYERVIDARLNAAIKDGNLKLANAAQHEKKQIESFVKTLTTEPKDLVVAVKKSEVLPDLPEGVPDDLVNLREIWAFEWQKIRAKLDGELQQSLKQLEIELTKVGDLDKANKVQAYRKSLLSISPAVPSTPTPAKKTQKATRIATATKNKPFENSLGMRFVPVPITGGPGDGKIVLFSIWETRVEDYEAFIKKDRDRPWPKSDFKQKDDHPAVNVSWEDAMAFCEWLTEKEQKKGTLGKNQRYRLPSDHEWSCAVGIGKKEDAEAAPGTKSNKLTAYPWGKQWPPPNGTGNYCGEETLENPASGGKAPIKGYSDNHSRTSPVGSFQSNEYGIYDLSGNVWEWCEDWLDSNKRGNRVARGASWIDPVEILLRSSRRGSRAPSNFHDYYGFRVVVGNSGN